MISSQWHCEKAGHESTDDQHKTLLVASRQLLWREVRLTAYFFIAQTYGA